MKTENRKERPLPRGGERGAALVVALFLITILTIMGIMTLNTSMVEIKMTTNQITSSQVFYAAEAGLERGLSALLEDLEKDKGTGKPWGNDTFAVAGTVISAVANTGSATFDEDIRNVDMWVSSPAVKRLSWSTGGYGVAQATYKVYFYRPAGTNREAYIMALATMPEGTAGVEYHLKVDDVSPYNNAVFTGSGFVGTVTGNVNVAGSIYSLGALNLSGNVSLTNYYKNMPSVLSSANMTPGVTDLEAKIRVKGANLTLSGSAQIGETENAGTATKETVEGVYVDGTFSSEQPVYADEQSNLVPNIPMPDMLDGLKREYGSGVTAYAGTTNADKAFKVFEDLARGAGMFDTATPPAQDSQGAVVNGNIAIANATADFSYLDSRGNGLAYVKATKTLTVTGTVVIKGSMSISTDVKYIAQGAYGSDAAGNQTTTADRTSKGAVLVVRDNVTLSAGFRAPTLSENAAYGGYLRGGDHTNSLGMVSSKSITFSGNPGTAYTGMFYGGTQVNFTKQVAVAGTIITGSANFTQVPDIYQVPALANYLPKGMPGGYTILNFANRDWRRVY